ncbi:MAG: chemotaxis protein CheW, partial [Proteobacteria bacterium]|nr:chemotaxis protein CheW [Pseudomonadota bacterium]
MNKSETEARVLDQFVSEAAANLKRIEDALLELKMNADAPEAFRSIFNSFHGIKGISGYVPGSENIGALSHEMEAIVKSIQGKALPVSQELLELILECHDELYRMLEDFQRGAAPRDDWKPLVAKIASLSGASESSESAKTKADPGGHGDVVRQQLAGLAIFMDQWKPGPMDPRLASAVRRKLNLIKRSAESVSDAGLPGVLAEALEGLERKSDWSQRDIDEFRSLVGRIGPDKITHDTLTPGSDTAAGENDSFQTGPVETRVQVKSSRLHQLSTLIADLTMANNRLNHELNLIASEHPQLEERLRTVRTDCSRVVTALEKTTQRIQLIELSELFNRVPRIVRKIAKEEAKRIELTIHGANTEVDRGVVDQLGDPITHIIRNAIDHGIETPGEREQAGKPPMGRIFINAYAVGKFVSIDITDDGRGIDSNLVREKAVAKGYVTPLQARSMAHDELLNIIFEPGFTTSDRITDVSGRGVGMDAVQLRLREIGGRVRVQSKPGQGTVIRLSFPNTFTLVNCLVVRCRDFLFAVPARYAKETLNIHPERIERFDGRDWLHLRGRLVRIFDLEEALEGLEILDPETRRHAFVLEAGDRRIIFRVDELVEVKTLSVRGLPAHLEHIKAYAGVTTLWSGQIAFFLHPLSIIDHFGATNPKDARIKE